MLENVSLLFVGGSVLLLAWQSHELAKQSRLSNQVAMASMMGQTGAELGAVHQILVDRPELWKYFYGGEPAPQGDDDLVARVSIVAEMLADCIEGALQIGRGVPAFGKVNLEDWEAYGRSVLETSPAVVAALHDARARSYWPCYHRLAMFEG